MVVFNSSFSETWSTCILPLTILQVLSHKTFMIDAFDRLEPAGACSPDPRASVELRSSGHAVSQRIGYVLVAFALLLRGCARISWLFVGRSDKVEQNLELTQKELLNVTTAAGRLVLWFFISYARTCSIFLAKRSVCSTIICRVAALSYITHRYTHICTFIISDNCVY